jgi:hypothetical protein
MMIRRTRALILARRRWPDRTDWQKYHAKLR